MNAERLHLEYASCDSPYACAAAPVIARKWVPVVVCHLLHGPKRFGDLRRAIPYISAKVLTENLQFMRSQQMIVRGVRGEGPAEVWYELTERGQDLSKVIIAMNQWGLKWLARDLSTSIETTESRKSTKTTIPLFQW